MALNLDRIIETFEFLQEWEDRYRFLIELGEKLPPMPEGGHDAANIVPGCVSQVWFTAAPSEEREGALVFAGDSDASTVKGLAALLIALYDNHTPEEIEHLDADALFQRLGLFDHLSPTRHVGVYGMVTKIRAIAREFAPAGQQAAPSTSKAARLSANA